MTRDTSVPHTAPLEYHNGVNGQRLTWQEICLFKQQQRLTALRPWLPPPEKVPPPSVKNVRGWPKISGVLTSQQLEITDANVGKLLGRLKSGDWSAEEVLQAFCLRAGIAHCLTNPLSEIFFERGLSRARDLDIILRETGKPVGVLHGLPISVKDVFSIPEFDSTLGYVAWANKPQNTLTPLLDRLQEEGAVLYCKTNVPQTLMSGECTNLIFGRTYSPFNTNLSAGGSSGGEGSLISMGGSPLGIGTDIAGSIRTPANFNGIYGLTPSTRRFPYCDAARSSGQENIVGVAGPMARSVEGLEIYTRAVLGTKPWEWDHSISPMPWNEDLYQEGLGQKRKLCFGLMRHDGIVRPHPPIERCLEETKQKLLSSGHNVIEFDAINIAEMERVAFKIFNSSGGKEVHDVLRELNEPLIDEVDVPDASWELSAFESWHWNKNKHHIRETWLKAWTETTRRTGTGFPMDGLIMPSGGHVAPPHGSMNYFMYELISNFLDLPCATIPVGFVDPVLDIAKDNFIPMSERDADNWKKYTPETYENGPVALQLMGMRLSEEKVLGLLVAVNRALDREANYQS